MPADCGSTSCCDKKTAPPFGEAVFWYRRVCKPGSVLTAIYLAPQLLAGSSRLLGTVGPTCCPSTALLRDRVYIVEPMLPWAGCALAAPFHPYCCLSRRNGGSGISLLHLSWGHPRRALPVILALWSPDFPHLGPFGSHPRLSNPRCGNILPQSMAIVKSPCKFFLKRVYCGQ